jgi:hypothetical protein
LQSALLLKDTMGIQFFGHRKSIGSEYGRA